MIQCQTCTLVVLLQGTWLQLSWQNAWGDKVCGVQHCFEEKCLRHLLFSPSGPAAYSISICDHWTPTLRMHNAYSVPDRLDDHKHKHCITALHCTTSVYTLVHTRNGGGDRPLPRLQSSSEQSKLVCWEQRLSPLGLAQQLSKSKYYAKNVPQMWCNAFVFF